MWALVTFFSFFPFMHVRFLFACALGQVGERISFEAPKSVALYFIYGRLNRNDETADSKARDLLKEKNTCVTLDALLLSVGWKCRNFKIVMMMTMANAEILNAAANAISSLGPLNPVSHQQRRWKGYWSRFWCFGPQKRTKRIVPSFRIEEGNAIEFLPNGSQQIGGAHHPTTLSTLLAPPSSPASLANSGNPSTVQSPAGFLSVASNSCSPGRLISTMFATGPYAHETQLVSPPVFSTFSTEPSTANFTPPPEMAHLTTPPSPEVPFAQMLASSSNTKATGQEHGLKFSSFPFISSGYGVTNDHLSSYQLFPGSPAGSLLSPRTSSSFPDLEFPAQWKLLHYMQDSFFPRNESSKVFNQEMATSRSSMVSQDLDVFCSSTAEFHLDHACLQSQSCEEQCSRGSHSLPREADSFFQSRNIEEEQHLETNKCCTTSIYSSSNDITLKFPVESSQGDQSRSK